MKNKRYWLIVAVLGMMLAYPAFGRPAFAYEKIVDFILKVYPDGPASAIPDDFLKTGSDDGYGFAHEGYIDGFKIICRSKGGIVKSLHAQKQFNTGDLSAEHTYYNILGSVLAKLMKKYNGSLVNEKGRGKAPTRCPTTTENTATTRR